MTFFRSTHVVLTTLALTAVVALTGCSTTASPDAAVTPAVTAPAPVETAPAPVAIATGDVITAEQAAALDTEVQRPWTMTDGTIVATTLTEALPATVVADITTVTQAAQPDDTGSASHAGLKASLAATGTASGRRIIAVFPQTGSRASTGNFETFWSTSMFNGNSYDSADQAVAALASLVAANPTGNVVIVIG